MRLVLTASILVSLLVQHSNSLISPSHANSRTAHGISRFAEVSGADIEQDVDASMVQSVGNSVTYRGKVNEIDYCIAPADVSLSRAFDRSNNKDPISNKNTMSLTQALNNASNRAVRRIILARCWPSEEALNKSLRLAAAAEKQAEDQRIASGSTSKCPVPRPILNLLMRRDTSTPSSMPNPKGRTNEQYVEDQIKAFDERYGSLPGYQYAEAYLESILCLATTGQESPRVSEVLESGIYDESYKRVLSVLKSVGVKFEELPGTNRKKISKKLENQDICLSMLDKLGHTSLTTIKAVEPASELVEASEPSAELSSKEKKVDAVNGRATKKKHKFRFWMNEDESKQPEAKKSEDEESESSKQEEKEANKESKKVDLGVVLLSSEETTMTRQLNSLSNIVQRALLFGGDQELLILSETLNANKEPFIERWYPGTDEASENFKEETRPGVQYLNALISLLRKAYDDGLVTVLEPSVPLIPSYSNAYERIMANLVELGSGYIRPMTPSETNMPKPRTATEELGRFAVWESKFRSQSASAGTYPEDLEGTWEVKDEVGGELIGISTVVFEPMGEVSVDGLQGLRWRLDPGPTHLDTVTFQVLSEDGTVLQYRGFIDRGARLEARFSKRPTRIRGSVMFQMRDGDIAGTGADYWKDMLPINYKTGTTKFIMTKMID